MTVSGGNGILFQVPFGKGAIALYSPGLKKLGKEFGLTAGKGRVYGLLEGFPIAMWDGNGVKCVMLALGRPENAEDGWQCDLEALMPRDRKAYRIAGFEMPEETPLLIITFLDTIGTRKRMRQFLQEALPAWRAAGLSQRYCCAQCGEAFEGAPEIALVKGVVLPIHQHCQDEFASAMAVEKRERTQAIRRESAEALRDGTTLKGVLGAILGGVVGAIPWVIIYMLGYVTSLGGLLIGAGAVFGYKKLSGRVGVGCVVSAVIVTAVMVFVATMAGDLADTARLILTGELAEANGLPSNALTLADLGWYQELVYQMPEWRESFRENLLMGYFYAAVGLFGFLLGSRHNLRARPGKSAQEQERL